MKIDGDAGSRPEVLHEFPITPQTGEVIGNLARCGAYVHDDATIGDLAEALGRQPDLIVVGITDRSGIVRGIVVRRELFDVLGRQFGREIYMNRPVATVMKIVPVFNQSRNIYSVAEEIAECLNHPLTSYFALATDAGEFAGVFSTRDMLIYLSEITKKDLSLAKRVQASIVKEEVHVDGDRFTISGASRMAKGVGGDFFTVIKYGDSEWLLALCDVSGKGMSASLLSAILGGITSAFDFSKGIGGYLQCVNDYVFDTFNAELFITGVFLDFNETRGVVSLYDAGHSYIYLVRQDRFRLLRSRKAGLPLGVVREGTLRPATFSLKKDDIIVIVTDGIDEQINAFGERFGHDRFAAGVRASRGGGIREMKQRIFQDIKRFRGNQPQHDDMTVLMLHWAG